MFVLIEKKTQSPPEKSNEIEKKIKIFIRVPQTQRHTRVRGGTKQQMQTEMFFFFLTIFSHVSQTEIKLCNVMKLLSPFTSADVCV